MKVNTNTAISNNPGKIMKKIINFWNNISPGWGEIWGPHIHHGFYDTEQNLPPIDAQEKLIEKLAAFLELKPFQKMLDVGCGMGGTSMYLAKKYQLEVVGINLSQIQLAMAIQESKKYPELKVSFKKDDAHVLENFSDHEFDIVWSLESCEQFYDKALFVEQINRVLKPGGLFMLATWCSDKEVYENTEAKKYRQLCEAFDLPYMPTLDYYEKLLEKHFNVLIKLDWTPYVKKSWELGILELKKYSLLRLLKLGGIQGLMFISKIKLIRAAFDNNRIRYGVFVAKRKG